MPKMVASCPESPQVGKSDFCTKHAQLDEEEPPGKKPRKTVTIDSVNLRVSTKVVNLTKDIPENDDQSVHVGCKNSKNVDRFKRRFAGIMALVQPYGIIVDTREMLTCESASQLFAQLLALRCDRGVQFKYLGYDRACEFQPFLKNLAAKNNEGAKILLKDTSYLVDRFHIKGHINPKCDIRNPLCEYHPDLPAFNELESVNTECAEQCFSFLGRFAHLTKYMGKNKFHFFLTETGQVKKQKIAEKAAVSGYGQIIKKKQYDTNYTDA